MPYELDHRADELIGLKVDVSGEIIIAPRALATSGRRPGVRAKRAARGVAGHQFWTGRREKTGHPFTAIG